MDATTQQAAVSAEMATDNNINGGLATDLDNNLNITDTNGDVAKETAAPVPTYDQQFPSLGGLGAAPGSDANSQPTPFGRWNTKPRVQSTTITQVT